MNIYDLLSILDFSQFCAYLQSMLSSLNVFSNRIFDESQDMFGVHIISIQHKIRFVVYSFLRWNSSRELYHSRKHPIQSLLLIEVSNVLLLFYSMHILWHICSHVILLLGISIFQLLLCTKTYCYIFVTFEISFIKSSHIKEIKLPNSSMRFSIEHIVL